MTGDAQQGIFSLATELDRCWLEQRFDDLKSYLAEDVVFVAPNGNRTRGRDAAIAGYREFMSRARIRRYQTGDVIVTTADGAAVAEYVWNMAWDSDGQSYEAKGKEVLVLSRSSGSWTVIWRTQLAA